MVRDVIRRCSSVTLDGGRRVVLLDEADYLTKDAQAALRGEVESLSVVNDFVMTANEPRRLIEPILSRFFPVSFDFKLDEEVRLDLKERLWNIAIAEGFTDVSDEQLFEIVDYGFPDMRRMVKSLQFQLQLA
jgi:DNA polymerase III delta prime subunit